MVVRLWLLAVLFGCVTMVFLGRLVHLQLVRGARYDRDIQEARLVEELLPARRGRILDRHGTVLVDNRASYHAAVVLAELEKEPAALRRTPVLRLDEHAIDLVAADLARRLDRSAAAMRQALVEELLLCPGVAVRRGEVVGAVALGLLAIPAEVVIRAEQSETDNDPAWTELAQSGMLLDDPREAARREYLLRHDQPAVLLREGEYATLCAELGRRADAPTEHLRQLLDPFAPEVALTLPSEDGGERFAWRLLEEDRQLKAATVLARHLGEPTMTVLDDLRQLLPRCLAMPERTAWFFVPAAQEAELASQLPSGVAPRYLLITGTPPGRRRVFLLQGDTEEETARHDGLFDLFLVRLAARLDVDDAAGWLGALLENHGEQLTNRAVEREFRLHQLVLDPDRLSRCCLALSERLTAGGVSCPPLAVEQAITMARRIADRDWRGHTRHDPLPLVQDLPYRLAQRIAAGSARPPAALAAAYHETAPRIPAVRIVQDVDRRYRFPGSASHLIGYLGQLSALYDHETALAMGLDPAGWVGRSGLEAVYDDRLQGTIGRRVSLRTPDGHDVVRCTEPVSGIDLELELDIDLQLAAEDALAHWYELAEEMELAYPDMARARQQVNHGRAGLALIDPATGALLALASNPGFDLRTVRRDYRELADPALHPGHPLHDHASEASQPCGSSMKVLTAMAALAEGKVGISEEIFSKGHMAIVAGRPRLREHQPFSPRSFTIVTALQKSSNVFFATLGQRLGGEALTRYQDLVGLGRNNAIDVGWQRPGLLPTPANLARLSPQDPVWRTFRSWSQAIGQGLSASPLQMVCVAAAVANGGTIIRPYLWRGAPAAKPAVPVRIGLTAAQLAVVRQGMELVTAPGGTARNLQVTKPDGTDVKVAAKTGTAEWGTRESREAQRTPEHAWLLGYAPAAAPRIAFAIFIHSGEGGGRACTGVAKRVLEAYFAKYPNGH